MKTIMPIRLSDTTLSKARDGITRPRYDRSALTTGIVHLGIGAFHRAHMASYVEACLATDPSWGICGVSLRSGGTRDALEPQDGLYTLSVRSGEDASAQIIGAVREVLLAPERPERLAQLLAAPHTRIVSLTVTEKGYCHDPATGRLNADHPDIVHDLAANVPRSAIGWLAHGLLARRAAGVPPFTLLSCDNLPSNGALLRQVMLDYLQLKAPDVVPWAQDALACPSSMVDRIVPATTDEDRAAVLALTGLDDAWPVMSEPFSQFVVEDTFSLGRPAWEDHGVTMVRDAKPFETMKLRMLNGSHSTLAYLGFLAGHETVADAMADPAFVGLIGKMMEQEITPTLQMPADIDLQAYRDALLARFSNTALRHKTYQIAMDGSQKLPQRLLAPIAQRLSQGQSVDRLALGVAGWMRYAMGKDEAGNAIPVQDPLTDRFARVVTNSDGGPASLVDGFLAIEEIFGPDLPAHEGLRANLTQALGHLLDHGAGATLARYAEL